MPSLTLRRVRPVSLWLALALALLSLHPGAARAADENQPLPSDEICKTHWTIEADWLLYCRNQRLGEPRDNIRRAVVVIHGKQRNAKSYYEAVNRLAEEEGRQGDTLVFALQFLTLPDVQANKLPKQVLYWERDGWKHGHRALNGARLSSFEVLDRVLKRIIDQNPNLEQIVIAGHSAGAQFAQKHAAGRRLDTSAWKGQLHYVITNAGSYMYLAKERPGDTSACADSFNDYRYGVEDNRVEYFTGTSPDRLWVKFAQYPVTLLLGDRDVESDEGDQSCPAQAQGKTRFERGQEFHRLTLKNQPGHLPAPGLSRFRVHVVRHVGHEFERMWDSHCGRQLLFGKGACSTGPAPKAAFPL